MADRKHRNHISSTVVLTITFVVISLEIVTLLEFALNSDAYHFGSEVNGLRHESEWHYVGFSLATLALLFASLFVERLLESTEWCFTLRTILALTSVFVFFAV
ncbi:hypothetical protein L4D06_24235 [Enterovibrio makurazakiensis]|uniref:hypothetical protein n=1 Tax=Enterovibrio makurazakiensis TaxID=2910232 RepID=UPI003D19C845